jgi:hypothetical protein
MYNGPTKAKMLMKKLKTIAVRKPVRVARKASESTFAFFADFSESMAVARAIRETLLNSYS